MAQFCLGLLPDSSFEAQWCRGEERRGTREDWKAVHAALGLAGYGQTAAARALEECLDPKWIPAKVHRLRRCVYQGTLLDLANIDAQRGLERVGLHRRTVILSDEDALFAKVVRNASGLGTIIRPRRVPRF
jgi:hypothetical protein